MPPWLCSLLSMASSLACTVHAADRSAAPGGVHSPLLAFVLHEGLSCLCPSRMLVQSLLCKAVAHGGNPGKLLITGTLIVCRRLRSCQTCRT